MAMLESGKLFMMHPLSRLAVPNLQIWNLDFIRFTVSKFRSK